MAGLAALMTRKKRDRRRELELKLNNKETDSTTDLRLPLTGKEAQEALQKKAAHDTIKKILNGKELLHQKSKSFDALSQVSYNNEDEASDTEGNPYSLIYFGLIILCIGVVITFVGLGEKGFKTFELKLIGPVLCLVGFLCVVLKVIQCSFPKLFQMPAFIKKIKKQKSGKLRDSDRFNLMEKGRNLQNGHLENGKSVQTNHENQSPRVVLQSAKQAQRPRSTIPNYIEASSDEDDFDKSANRNRQETSTTIKQLPAPGSSTNLTERGQIEVEAATSKREDPLNNSGNGEAMTTIHKAIASENKLDDEKKELVLTPKGLML